MPAAAAGATPAVRRVAPAPARAVRRVAPGPRAAVVLQARRVAEAPRVVAARPARGEARRAAAAVASVRSASETRSATKRASSPPCAWAALAETLLERAKPERSVGATNNAPALARRAWALLPVTAARCAFRTRRASACYRSDGTARQLLGAGLMTCCPGTPPRGLRCRSSSSAASLAWRDLRPRGRRRRACAAARRVRSATTRRSDP